MMKNFITTIAIIGTLAATPAQATESCEDTINVTVNGLVCDFCARALEKLFSKQEKVSAIKVDLDNGLVKVHMHQGQTLDDETLKELITDSGYDATSISKDC